jgi:carboxymethylenebutenolidase
MGVFGNEDKGPSPDDVNDYEAALRLAGVTCEFHRYDGAGQSFQGSGNAERYRPEQSEDAWAKSLDFLARNLNQEGETDE